MRSSMENKKILLTLTTVYDSENYKKIDDISKYNIKEISLFLTGLNFDERKKLYDKLENFNLEKIPHIHLRNDMEINEIDYLYERYKVECFNIHPKNDAFPFLNDLSKYRSITYIENTLDMPTEEELDNYAGLCLDFSHLEEMYLMRTKKRSDESILKILNTHQLGCGHISAIKKEAHIDVTYPSRMHFASHKLDNLNELDYLEKYKSYLPKIMSLEFVNDFSEQLEMKKYLEKLLNI